MKFIADLHIHSHYSIATSGGLVPEHLELWARLKGIDVVGTGDCIHPGWADELVEKLEPAGDGLYRLRDSFRLEESRRLTAGRAQDDVRFILTGEVSNIYKRDGKVRKVHNLCVFPDFESAGRVRSRLDRMGNIRSDGRPILGLDSRILLEMVLDSSERSFLIPCHIWTPWFSVLGAGSGFDRIEECYGDLAQEIFALETGLSSDPPMNRTCGFLDRYTLVSNSDAHSPEKLGREANLFDTEIGYDAMRSALKGGGGFLGTMEFFPQEGKYHFDGHRRCRVRWDPLETARHGGICSRCGRPVTRGVMHRVAELADRADPCDRDCDFRHVTPLPDLLAEIMGLKSGGSRRVMTEYRRLVESIGPEFRILLDAPIDELREKGGELLAEGIGRLRRGEVILDEGYDGEFGRVRVFREGESKRFTGRSLFASAEEEPGEAATRTIAFDIARFKEISRASARQKGDDLPGPPGGEGPSGDLTPRQRAAVEHVGGPCMVIAGPGTGKTGILARRIARLVNAGVADPKHVLAITFSRRAAAEMTRRVRDLLPVAGVTTDTFHGLGLSILKEHCGAAGRDDGFFIADEDDVLDLLRGLAGSDRDAARRAAAIEAIKQGMRECGDFAGAMEEYDRALTAMNAVDLADLVYLPLRLFRERGDILAACRDRYRWILVDEFQDINPAQYNLLTLLAGEGKPELFVIGDPDQAIYGFRGSDAAFMMRLADDYPGTQVIRLDRSFRCPDPIMKAAAQILGSQDAPEGREADVRVLVQEFASDRSEADWIAATIEKAMGGVRSFSIDSGVTDGTAGVEGASFGDFAVLCRASFQFGALAEAFRNHAVPHQIAGTETFLREEPYRSAVRMLRRIYRDGADAALSSGAAEDIRAMMEKGDAVADIVKFLMIIREDPAEAIDRLVARAVPFGGDFREFFRSCSLRRGADDRDETAEAVSIMTIHASKGLEFDTVFIPACEAGIIPFELFGKRGGDEMAEEERLFYVGVTRTAKQLCLSHAKKRMVRGRMMAMKRSPFLDRLEESLLVRGSRGPGRKKGEVQLDLFE